MSDDNEPPTPPTAEELDRVVADTRQAAYWLGPRFLGIEVSSAAVNRYGVSVTYGPWTCDSGCTDSGGVYTRRRRDVHLDDADYAASDLKACWSRIGKAVAVLAGCDPEGYPQELEIYSGTRSISITSLYTPDGERDVSVRRVIRGLRPLNGNAPWPLQRPKRLTCRELRHVARGYRRHMPQILRPHPDC